MKKRIVTISTALCLFLAVSVPAFAASFSFHFTPPFANSMKSTSNQTVKTLNAAYVNPNTSATPTNYLLSPTPHSATNATNILTNISTSGRRSLTYESGYGGVGTSLCLSGYPSNYDFVTYNVSGTWGP